MNALWHEGAFLHKAMFGSEADHEILSLYEEYFSASGGASCCTTLNLCKEKGLNIRAIEYALRLRNRKNALTQRVEVLSLLCEVRSDHYHKYYNDKSRCLSAYLRLGMIAFSAGALMIQGQYLLRRHSLD